MQPPTECSLRMEEGEMATGGCWYIHVQLGRRRAGADRAVQALQGLGRAGAMIIAVQWEFDVDWKCCSGHLH